MDIWELCKCNSTQICPFCKGLVIATIAIVCGAVVFFMLKGKKKKQ